MENRKQLKHGRSKAHKNVCYPNELKSNLRVSAYARPRIFVIPNEIIRSADASPSK